MFADLRRCAVVLAVCLAAGPARAADCATERSAAELSLALDQMEAAYRELDIDGFQARFSDVGHILPCLGEPLDRALVARLHRSTGLFAFVVRDTLHVPVAFSAARGIEPDYALPEALVPPGHPLRQMYDDVRVEPGPGLALDRPNSGFLLVDGRQSFERPSWLPIVLQQVADGGQVLSTAYLWPEDPTPSLSGVEPAASAPGREARGSAIRGGSRPLLLSTAGGLVLGVASYSFALVNSAQFHDMGTAPDELDGLRTRVNVGQAVATGALGVSLVSGVGWLVTVVR